MGSNATPQNCSEALFSAARISFLCLEERKFQSNWSLDTFWRLNLLLARFGAQLNVLDLLLFTSRRACSRPCLFFPPCVCFDHSLCLGHQRFEGFRNEKTMPQSLEPSCSTNSDEGPVTVNHLRLVSGLFQAQFSLPG